MKLTNDDKQFLKEFMGGVSLAIGVLAVFILFIAIFQVDEDKVTTNAKVVDTYKGCDVVRWSSSNLAHYQYFLHCDK